MSISNKRGSNSDDQQLTRLIWNLEFMVEIELFMMFVVLGKQI